MIETKALTKKYGDLVAVDALDLSVEAGELFVFLGPNGAGKTTTIKILTCLLQPTSGEAIVGGINVVEYPNEVKKIMGYLPETLSSMTSCPAWSSCNLSLTCTVFRRNMKRSGDLWNSLSFPQRRTS